ncbi:MAR1 protein, partial [Polypterus senegalus]
MVNQLRVRKAIGICDIRGELLPADGKAALLALQANFASIWETGITPADWKIGLVILIWKGITGIAVLVLILVALLIIGCWFYRRRNGYIMIKTRGPVGSIRKALRAGRGNEDLFENKVPLNDYGNFGPVVPNAPPAYDKIEQSPPPYTP